MSRRASTTTLGEIAPSGSRQLGRRSAVCATDDAVSVGLEDGTVRSFAPNGRDQRWQRVPEAGSEPPGSVVALEPFDGGVIVGERGPDGWVRHLDDDGRLRWRYRGADDVGEPAERTRFCLPFVVDVTATDGDGDRPPTAYVATRRYERGPDGDRTFHSVVAAFAPDGTVRWKRTTDASPIALSVRGDRLAVAFNRCPGDKRDGLVVLDASDGSVRRRWDPPGDGQRRVGDVALLASGLVATSHADYRGYWLDEVGVRWSVDLGRPTDCGGETVYAYPNHVHATDSGAVFVTGNTYPEDGRETDGRHPREHTAVGVAPDGGIEWETDVGGFTHGIATDGETVAVPAAQHFRDRDPAVHGVTVLDVREGRRRRASTEGVATAASLRGDGPVVIEEPVRYHDDGELLGAYRLHCF